MFSLVLFQMMIPSQIFIIPQYLMVSGLGALNTIFGLVFPGIVTAFGTFLLRQAYMTLPERHGRSGQTGRLQHRSDLPVYHGSSYPFQHGCSGNLYAVFAFKDLMWPMIVNTDKNMLTLSAALAKMQGQYASNFPQLMAASLIACLPMIVIYVIFQKQFIEGIATSGWKIIRDLIETDWL